MARGPVPVHVAPAMSDTHVGRMTRKLLATAGATVYTKRTRRRTCDGADPGDLPGGFRTSGSLREKRLRRTEDRMKKTQFSEEQLITICGRNRCAR